MASIGIITIHNSQNNYGGVLQCFALYQYLTNIGYSVEVIDLHRPNNADFIDSIRFRNMRSKVSPLVFIKGWVKEILGIKKLRNPDFKPNWNEEAGKKFSEFNQKVKMSQPYCYIPDLYHNPPHYDIYISGSDQLWNPEQPYCLEPYFLTFVNNQKSLKISYATSIGLSNITNKEKNKFKKWLSSYNSISVREEQACRLLESITNKRIHRVPDPTFLLNPEDWIKMSVSPKDFCNYLLIFNLGQNPEIFNIGLKIAKEMNLKLKIIEQNYNYIKDPIIEIIENAGPLEFIGLIKNARLVITNSFHCTVFSIITGTYNFYTYISPDNNRGSRIVDLLNIFELSDHILYSLESIPSVKQLSNIKIDTVNTYNIIKREQKIGRTFLNESLSIKNY